MRLIEDPNAFVLIDCEVIEVEFVKRSKRGTSALFKMPDNEILVSLHKAFSVIEEANTSLKSFLEHKAYKEKQKEKRSAINEKNLRVVDEK